MERRLHPSCALSGDRLCLLSMTDDDDEVAESNALDADDRALAVHEAGHAAVAHAFGAGVVSVEIEVASGNGETVHGREIANIENLAVSSQVTRPNLILQRMS